MPLPDIVTGQVVEESKLIRAKQLRSEMTFAESLLWSRLRRSQLDGLHVRRQQVIRGFIADFFFHAASLVVEVDGESHEGREDRDRERDGIFRVIGLDVLRFRNEEIMADIERVIETIRSRCRERVSSPNPPAPFPEGKGE